VSKGIAQFFILVHMSLCYSTHLHGTYLSPTDALYFSIAIVRVSKSGGTRLLGSVQGKKEEILTLVEKKQGIYLLHKKSPLITSI
jgi:hypothetical protein